MKNKINSTTNGGGGYLPEAPKGRFLGGKKLVITSRIQRWNILQTIFALSAWVLNAIFIHLSRYIEYKKFMKKYLKKDKNDLKYFAINDAKVACPFGSADLNSFIHFAFYNAFLIPCYYHDNYDKEIFEKLSPFMDNGFFCYKDGVFDVTVRENDVVIDAGAWIGDFSAYAASKNAVVYAFEPTTATYEVLKLTSVLNKGIIPVKEGLADKEGEIEFYTAPDGANALNSIKINTINKQYALNKEVVHITTLDQFVEKNNIKRVNFIKADIEGAERDMLRGAANILKTFSPKLVISTYHLPDDPPVIEEIIRKINPRYRIVQTRKRLFACVPDHTDFGK